MLRIYDAKNNGQIIAPELIVAATKYQHKACSTVAKYCTRIL